MRPSVVFLIALVGWSSVEIVRSQSAGESTVEVNLKQGAIEASKIDLADGKYYYAFKSIPYAEPPVGSLRFKDPVPAGPWSGVRNGSVETTPCPQIDMMTLFSGEMQIIGEEDCLFLDVYTPRPYSSDLPVMVWIHGGAFRLGDIKSYSPVHLMSKDVVVVCIQYRLGTLGFLSTEDSVIPGNRAMKDQVLALRWVQENIRDLGGDPSRVTIFGESAGGISVHFHMLSPMSKGLFQRGIAQSGTALLPGFIRSDHKEKAAAVGQMLECPGVDPAAALDSQALYDCLQDVPKEKLVMLEGAFAEFMMGPLVMVPSVDGEFLPDHPATLLKEGRYHKVDFMTGVTRDEGGIIVRTMFFDTSVIDSLVQNFSTNGPHTLNLESDDESKVYVAKRIFYHYLGNIEITEENADSAAKMYSDANFNIPMDLVGKMHSRDVAYGKKIFLYEFHYLGGEFSLFDTPNTTIGKQWVSHGDELQYLFDMPPLAQIKKDQDKFMSEIMVTLWTNFAATGDPTPHMSLGFKWSPVSGPDLRYLILKPSPYMRGYTRSDEMEFWMNLPTKYNKKYYPERFA